MDRFALILRLACCGLNSDRLLVGAIHEPVADYADRVARLKPVDDGLNFIWRRLWADPALDMALECLEVARPVGRSQIGSYITVDRDHWLRRPVLLSRREGGHRLGNRCLFRLQVANSDARIPFFLAKTWRGSLPARFASCSSPTRSAPPQGETRLSEIQSLVLDHRFIELETGRTFDVR